MKKSLLVVSMLVASLGYGEDSTTSVAPGSTEAVVPSEATDSKIIGAVDLRPSQTPSANDYHFENVLSGGYQFNKDLRATLNLYLENNIFNPGEGVRQLSTRDTGLYTRVDVGNIGQIGSTKISYANRVYLPVSNRLRDKGHLTSIRNYFNFTNQLSSVVTASVSIVPIFHLYDTAGAVPKGPDSIPSEANPWFAQRLYAGVDVAVGPITISPVLWYQAARGRNAGPDAKNSSGWSESLELDLDVIYGITPNFGLGLGYYSADLFGRANEALTSGGTYQAVIQASL